MWPKIVRRGACPEYRDEDHITQNQRERGRESKERRLEAREAVSARGGGASEKRPSSLLRAWGSKTISFRAEPKEWKRR